MGLLGKVSSLKTKGKIGLLSKSLTTLGKIAADVEKSTEALETVPEALSGAPTGTPPEPAEKRPEAAEISSKIAKLSLGIDSPAYLFKLIQGFIGFSNGGLFLLNKEETSWIPLASSGWQWDAAVPFLRTRALMPELDTQSSRILALDSVEKISGLFPEGEFEGNRDVVLKAFYHEEKLIGLLIFEAKADDALKRVKGIITSSAHRVVRTQHDFLNSFPDSILESHESLREELQGMNERLSDYALVKLAFEDVIQVMRKAIDCISPAWLHHILSKIFAGLFMGICKAYEGTNNHLYLLIPVDMMLDEELSAHQSALSLQKHFRETGLPFRINFQRVAPGEIQGIEK
jgi:hypothetical protein